MIINTHLIFIIILIFIFIIINIVELNIYCNDLNYLFNILFYYKYKLNKNKNNIDSINFKNLKVLIFCFDNRIKLSYLNLHNDQFNLYSSKWKNISYEFIDKCDKNIYWCKIFIMLEKLKSNKYDYVMWSDTDVFIANINKSIQEIFASYNSDIFISYDNDYLFSTKFLNAGLFAVKNSLIDIKFLEDCLNEFSKSKCLNLNGKVSGLYSFKCYEQGIMNELIYSKYIENTTILNTDIFNNTIHCNKNSFFIHNYGVGKLLRTNDDISFDKKIKSSFRNNNDIYNCFLKIKELN